MVTFFFKKNKIRCVPTHFAFKMRSKDNRFDVLTRKKNCLKIILSVENAQSTLKAPYLVALFYQFF
jgi:hypothetical protein